MDGRDERLYGFAEHELSATWLGDLDRAAPPLRSAGRAARAQRQVRPTTTRSAWAGTHTIDFAIDLDELVEDLHQRLEWARNQIELPAGRYETILPPSAVADLMIYAYWTASARDAEEGRNVFSRSAGGAGGGTRIGEQLTDLPLTLRSDPAAHRAWSAPRSRSPTASGGGLQSVFDNGAPIAADRLDQRRPAEPTWSAPAAGPPQPAPARARPSGT